MSDVEVRVDASGIRRAMRGMERKLRLAFEDCIDDLVRTSSETAPHDKGILEKSHSKEIAGSTTKPEGTVSYTVRETYSGGNFNYALKMHEGTYNLGPGSLAKPGGTGMSGRTYRVGNKFLTRPLEGEKDKYKEHIEQSLQEELRT